MNKERWTKIALDMEPHIKAIQKITKQAGMDILSLAAVSDSSWASYIDDETSTHYGIDIKNEITKLLIDQKDYYTKN